MTRSSSGGGGSSARLKSLPIETPTFQNWSCHGCAECCRGGLLIEISAEEKRRIDQQGWTAGDGVAPDAMIVTDGNRFRLGHQADGACVFLDSSGRCRIHARFGESAKPLACRLYPFAIHPEGKKLTVSLRFGCPSAVANRGRPLPEQVAEIRRMAELIVPAGYQEGSPPPVVRESGLNWADFVRYVEWLDKTFADASTPVALKLLRALHSLRSVESSHFDQLTGSDANDILGTLARNATEKLPVLPASFAAPSRFGRFFCRTLVFEYGRRVTMKELQGGDAGRVRRLWMLARFASATGRVPALSAELKPVPFAEIETRSSRLPPDAEALLTRFFRVKIRGLHFCGAGYYGVPLVEGFQSLALLFPVIMWLSRWLAVSDQRSTLSDPDVARAVAIADPHHGYSPRLGSAGARWRVRLLAQRDDIARLCWRYGR